MNALALLLSPAGLAGLTEDQLCTVLDGLRKELAPTGVMESILVDQIASYVGRLRRAALAEKDTETLDPHWFRYQQMAERGFWKAYNELMKGRRQQAREAKAAAKTATAPSQSAAVSSPTPSPAPAPAVPRPQISTLPPARPAPAISQKSPFASVTSLEAALAALRDRQVSTASASQPRPSGS